MNEGGEGKEERGGGAKVEERRGESEGTRGRKRRRESEGRRTKGGERRRESEGNRATKGGRKEESEGSACTSRQLIASRQHGPGLAPSRKHDGLLTVNRYLTLGERIGRGRRGEGGLAGREGGRVGGWEEDREIQIGIGSERGI